jgi:hypothetical protein
MIWISSSALDATAWEREWKNFQRFYSQPAKFHEVLPEQVNLII